MFAIGTGFLLCFVSVHARFPTLRDLVDPSEQLSLRDTLSKIVEFEYKDQVISSDDDGVLPPYAHRLPTITQLNKNYSDILYQGDIRLPTYLLRGILDSSYNRKKRTAFRDKRYPSIIWKRGVPFAFHKSMNKQGRRSILAAIQFYRKHTCIRFKRRTNEEVYLLFVGNDQGCWSTVGRDAYQRPQIVSIGRGCEAFGITSHELAHALGLFHEQSRYDRDNWITIYPQRIPQSLLYNFAKVGPKQMTLYGTPYDIGSVMQYTPFEFSIDPRVPSMVAVDINEQGSMGQLAGPSYLDVQILNAHYSCGARCPFPIACQNGGIQNSHRCGACICPTGFGGTHCARPQAPSIRRCVGRLYARRTPRRMRLKIAANSRASGPRTCNYHIMLLKGHHESMKNQFQYFHAPKGTRIHLVVEKVKSTCLPGCWRETVEFKVRKDKRITGNRFCCALTSKKRILSNSNVVPVMLKAVRNSAMVIVQYSFVERKAAHDDVENLEEANVVFGAGEKTFGDNNEFELEIQRPLGEGESAEAEEEVAHDEGTSEIEDKEDELSSINADFYALPSLDPDLEEMLYDGEDVEIDF